MAEGTYRIRNLACASLIAAVYAVHAGNLLINNGYYIDDRLYLYTINFLVCEPSSWNGAFESLLEILRRGPYSEEDVALFQFRHAYSDNYLIHAAMSCAAHVLLPQRLLGVDYGTWIYVIVQVGVGLSHLLCISVVLWAVASDRGTRIPYVVLLGVGTLAFLAIDFPVRNWRLTNAPSALDFVLQTVIFAISPGFEFDVFGLTPRSDATLLLIAVTAFRWQQRIHAGYWTIVLASLVHGTYGTLMLAVYLVLDAILQPSRLRSWRCAVPVALVILGAVFRVQSFEAFGGTPIQVGGIAVAGAVIGALLTGPGERLVNTLSAVKWLRTRPSFHAETLLLLAGMTTFMAVAFLVGSFSAGLTEKYVAHELSGRPIALLRVPVLLGIYAIIMNPKTGGSTWVRPPVAIAVSVLGLVSGVDAPGQSQKSWWTAEEMEPGIRATISDSQRALSRLQLYYVFSCSVDRECGYLTGLNSRLGGR